MKIRSVGYLGLGASDPLAWLRYGVDVMGMMPARAVPGESWGIPQSGMLPKSGRSGIAEDGSVFLKLDERQWRIAVHPDPGHAGLQYIGLELDGPLELQAAVRELQAEGVEVSVGTPAEALARAVSGIAKLRDPSGNALELFYGPTTDYLFQPACPGVEFVAGSLGPGHLNLFVTQQPACFDFYTRVLGFRLTDYIRLGPQAQLQFLRCNRRHHSIAMLDMGGLKGLQHLMIEVRDIDSVGRVLDRARQAGVQVTSSIGRHRNDGVLSFYMRSPSDFDVEVGCEGRLIDESWTTNEFCEGDVWGHDGIVDAVQKTGENMRIRQQARGTNDR